MPLYRPLSTEWHDLPLQDRVDRCGVLMKAAESPCASRLQHIADLLFFVVDNLRDVLESHPEFRSATRRKIDEAGGNADFTRLVDHSQLRRAWEEARARW